MVRHSDGAGPRFGNVRGPTGPSEKSDLTAPFAVETGRTSARYGLSGNLKTAAAEGDDRIPPYPHVETLP